MTKPEPCSLTVCEQMQELRDALDALGVEWYDDTEEWELYSFALDKVVIVRTERTKVAEPRVSVIYGYSERQGERIYSTYGAPDLLECFDCRNDPDPIPMSVEEILETCFKEASDE